MMVQCVAPAWVVEDIQASLARLQVVQTAPFEDVFSEHLQCVQQCRELQVRLAQLDKEAAELRDENASMHGKVQRADEALAHDYAAQAATAQASAVQLEKEVSVLYKDKARLLEELVAANAQLTAAREQVDTLSTQLTQSRAEITTLREQLVQTATTLESERQARLAATSELQSSFAIREEAVAEAERLRGENAVLVRRLVELKEKEIDRMNEINKLHEEALAQALSQRKEAAAEREAVELIRSRAASMSIGGISLKELMHLPAAGTPSAGHTIASCGMDRVVQLWDLNLLDASTSTSSNATLHGMTGAVNDVVFTCDGIQLLGAGADKSLHLWDIASGQTRHTLTGHSAAVTSVAASPLDSRLAVSCSEDRSLKLWDLARGFSLRSVPCTKMPHALTMSRDGNTILTGHLDGSICLWDVRQCRAGSSTPLMEARDHTQAITSLQPTHSDSLLLVACKDNSLCLWDFRTMTTQRIFKSPTFTVGTIGSMGRGRCRVELSHDGRFLAAGAADGSMYVWDLQSASAAAAGRSDAAGLSVLKHHKDAVVAAVWSPDGMTLTTADKGGVVAFWTFTGH